MDRGEHVSSNYLRASQRVRSTPTLAPREGYDKPWRMVNSASRMGSAGSGPGGMMGPSTMRTAGSGPGGIMGPGTMNTAGSGPGGMMGQSTVGTAGSGPVGMMGPSTTSNTGSSPISMMGPTDVVKSASTMGTAATTPASKTSPVGMKGPGSPSRSPRSNSRSSDGNQTTSVPWRAFGVELPTGGGPGAGMSLTQPSPGVGFEPGGMSAGFDAPSAALESECAIQHGRVNPIVTAKELDNLVQTKLEASHTERTNTKRCLENHSDYHRNCCGQAHGLAFDACSEAGNASSSGLRAAFAGMFLFLSRDSIRQCRCQKNGGEDADDEEGLPTLPSVIAIGKEETITNLASALNSSTSPKMSKYHSVGVQKVS